MKVNAIGSSYVSSFQRNRINNSPVSQPTVEAPKISTITFKAGNKDQAILYVAEQTPYFKEGGVATVMQDMRVLRVSEKSPTIDKNSIDFWKPTDKVLVDALYNGQKVYNAETGTISSIKVAQIPADLPATSAFKKYAGKYFMTSNPNFQEYASITEFFKNEEKIIQATKRPNLKVDSNIFILEDVTGEKKMLDFGGTNDTEIKLFRVCREHEGKLVETNDFKIFTDVTASWKKPYQGGGYATNAGGLSQTWKGDGDARAAKAFVELIERICEVKSKDPGAVKFDPATIMLNDSQASYAAEYMAQKAAKGGEFWKGKKPTVVGHNLAEGYIQRTSYMNMFVNIADKELRNAVSENPEYIKALKEGPDAVEAFFAKIIPNEIKDAQGKVSPMMNAIYLAKQGYVPMITTVSEEYYKKIISDMDFIPGLYEHLKELSEKGRFDGITNPFENAGMDPYSGGVTGYYNEYTFPDVEAAGDLKGKKISKYSIFDRNLVNETSVDISHVREIKRQNKISLLERFDKKVLDTLKELKNVEGHETDLATVIAGLPDKKVEVYGHIDSKYVEALKRGEDIKVITSWGRGDTQKALDSVLKSFANYVEKNGEKDPNSVLVLGGALDNYSEEKPIKALIKELEANPKLKGRFVYLNGFAPNKPLASAADFAIFPSRFAPCELTDLEAMKVFCAPIVTNCQGLAQKNFDASIKDKATGYKTKHDFNLGYKELKDLLSKEDAAKMEQDVTKFKRAINNFYRISHGGKALSESQITETIRKDAALDYAYKYEILRPYRDKVVETELTECLERALITDRNDEIQTTMVKNHLKQYTEWENNGALNASGKSSAQRYRDLHFGKDGAEIKEEDTILAKLKKNYENFVKECKQGIDSAKEKAKEAGSEGKNSAKSSSTKKYLGIGAAILAGLGIGYYFYKNKQQTKEPENKLSCSV